MKHPRLATAPSQVRSLATSLTLTLPLVLLTACGGGGGGGSPTPAVTAPATGAVWGGNRTIRWTPRTTDGNSVQLLLSDDGGATFGTTLSASTPDDGSFDFDTTGFGDDDDYRVRVVLSNGNTLNSGNFSIDNTVPVTTLTAPVGSEIIGGTPTVTWTTVDANPGTMEIRLSSDDGATFPTIVAAATTDDGTYEWSAGALADGTQYRLQITPRDLAGNVGGSSTSSQSFEIDNTEPVVQLTAPLGGESWSGLRTITWTTTDTHVSTVTISLSSDSGATFGIPIATDIPDTGSFVWTTGETIDGTNLRIRVVATDLATNQSAPAESTSNFALLNLRINGPVHYFDANQTGSIDAGDEVYLRFDKPVVVNSPAATDFALDVAGDTFGAGASVALGPEIDSVIVTLGTNPTLRTRGSFDEDELLAGRPSGMDVAATIAANAIEDAGSGVDASPSGTKDIRPTFVPVSTGVTTAGTTTSVAAADLDLDGDIDFVIGEGTGVGIGLLYGDGSGGFTPQAGAAVAVVDLALGDVDADGLFDLVIADGTGVRLATGVGAGAFSAFGTAFGSDAARAVALADLDGDGDLDLFVGHGNSRPDRVFLNDGSGAFTATVQGLGAATTVSLAVGDVDGDCDLDVITVAGTGGQPVRVWTNNGAGSFAAGDSITLTQAQEVALGDMDGDGDLDAVVGVLGQNEVHLNDGTGTFGGVFQFFGNNDNRGTVLVDIDGDGDLDVATVKFDDGERWWFNDGTGRLTESLVRGLPDDAISVIAARLDADSDVDLFVAVDQAPHRVYLSSASGGQPAAGFSDAGATIPSVASRSGLAGDFDRDGALDVALSVEGGAPRILFGDAAGTFTEGASFGASGFVLQASVDVDCDGDLDLVGHPAADPTQWSVLEQGANGDFSAGATGLEAVISSFVDVDRDGDLDFVGADVAGVPGLWLNDGDGAFTDSGADLGSTAAVQASIEDLDADGDLDIALSDANDLRVLENDGSLAFTAAFTSAAIAHEEHLATDVDSDGDLDLLTYTLTTSPTTSRFIVVRNDGALTFSAQAPTGALLQTDGFAYVDIDDDGAEDIVTWRTSNTNAYHVHFGNGAGGFTFDSTTAVTDLQEVLVGDFDRDGDTDLYVVRYDTVGSAAAAHRLLERD